MFKMSGLFLLQTITIWSHLVCSSISSRKSLRFASEEYCVCVFPACSFWLYIMFINTLWLQCFPYDLLVFFMHCVNTLHFAFNNLGKRWVSTSLAQTKPGSHALINARALNLETRYELQLYWGTIAFLLWYPYLPLEWCPPMEWRDWWPTCRDFPCLASPGCCSFPRKPSRLCLASATPPGKYQSRLIAAWGMWCRGRRRNTLTKLVPCFT